MDKVDEKWGEGERGGEDLGEVQAGPEPAANVPWWSLAATGRIGRWRGVVVKGDEESGLDVGS